MLPEAVVEGDGWVGLCAPVRGEFLDLWRWQTSVQAPAKLVPGLKVKAEMPVRGDRAATIELLRESLALAGAVLEKGCGAESQSGTQPIDIAAVGLRLRESLVEFVTEGNGFAAHAEGIRLIVRITRAVVFQTDLVRLQPSEEAVLRALAHFALALNARLRLARASLVEDRLVLEVALPPSALTPEVIQKVVGSLQVGVAVAKKECAALCDPQTAARYWQFHKET